MSYITLEPADILALREYVKAIDELESREPERLPHEVWDKLLPQIQATGEVPPEYRGVIGIYEFQEPKHHYEGDRLVFDEGEQTSIGYYDIEWDRWSEELGELHAKYHDVITKALRYALNNDKDGEERLTLSELLKMLVAVDYTDSITIEQKRETPPKLTSTIPKKHVMPISKLANYLNDAARVDGTLALDIGRKKGDMKILCILTYEGDDVKLTSRHPFTEYDRQVADAIASIYEYGDKSHIITPAIVYRTMVNATKTETPSQQQIEAVTHSLDKMRFMRVQIDCTEELTRRKLALNGEQITGGKIDTYLLALEKVEIIAGGQVTYGYKILKRPIIYEYSKLIKQVITIPAKLLDVRDKDGAKIPNTERRISVKGYILRRVSIMKGKSSKKISHHVLFDTIYSDIYNADEQPSDKEQRSIRQYVWLVLDHLKREKYITDYEILKKGKKEIGAEIKF